MVKILTIAQMRQVEEECAKIGLPPSMLMENAGKAVAEEVRKILGTINQQHILIGPGNSGGDRLVAARHLNDWRAKVSRYLFIFGFPQSQIWRLDMDKEIKIPVLMGHEISDESEVM